MLTNHRFAISLRSIAVGTAMCAAVVGAYAATNTGEYRPKAPADLNSHELSAQYLAYPYTFTAPPAQTPAPKGYEAYHIEHYGRHGSRWMIDQKDYDMPLEALERGARAGALTPLGEKTLAVLRDLRAKEDGRREELTDLGALQHQAIARRMVENYPLVFAPGSTVDARSTVVIRCIISMANALTAINQSAPGVKVHTDASEADMRYMNFDDTIAAKAVAKVKKGAMARYNRTVPMSNEYLNRLFSNKKFIADSLKNYKDLDRHTWRVISSLQNHLGFPWLADEIFSREDMRAQWLQSNARWFSSSGLTPMNQRMGPATQRNLLRNIIESADTALVSPVTSANLRFGHDGMVLPLTALMEINDYGREYKSFEELEPAGWYCQDIIPMAANIQWVFYRPTGKKVNPNDLLVKVMLNEREVRLPIATDSWPYYRWTDLRNYYLNKLNNLNTAKK